MDMELRQLNCFLACARNHSLTLAAEELYTTQPHVSMVIKSLEQELGTALFIRKSKGVELTEAGKRIYSYAVNAVRNAEAISALSSQSEVPLLRIVSNSSSHMTLLLTHYYLQQKEELQIEYRECGIEEMIERVFDGVDDYGICTGLPIMTDYTVICRREIISIKNGSAVASKRTYPDDVGNFGAFIFERVFSSGGKSAYSFGSSNGISEFDSNEVVYQTKTSYNGTTITSGSSNDSNTLCLGANAYNISLGRCQEFSNVAIYYFALYNKSLTIEEIETEKAKLENMWDSKLNKS